MTSNPIKISMTSPLLIDTDKRKRMNLVFFAIFRSVDLFLINRSGALVFVDNDVKQ